MRRRLIASDSTTLRFNDHVAWRGDGPSGLAQLATSVFSLPVLQGAQLHLVADVADPERLAGLGRLDERIEAGELVVSSFADTYRALPDVTAQLAVFEEMLDAALDRGFNGMCVVADNSPLVVGGDEQFAGWVAWEATADRFQARRPVMGVCYFDGNTVSEERLDDLASMHPIVSARFADAPFQVYVDRDTLRIVGEVDRLCSERLYRVLSGVPRDGDFVLDCSELAFIDHSGLLVLDRIAAESHGLRVRGASSFVRRVWTLLDVPKPNLEFC